MRPVLLTATGLLAAGTLAACGSSPAATSGSAPSGGSSPSSYTGANVGGANRFPGTSGTIADISGSTVQVQNQTDGQVAVTYTGTTTFTAEMAATLSDVKVGSCVSVTPVTSSSTTSSGSAAADAVTAAAVRISQPQNGSCTGGFGAFGGGSRPSGFPSGRPTDLPSGAPGGPPSGGSGGAGGAGGLGGFGGANGTVASVTATGFTVTETRPDFGDAQGQAGASAGASPSMTSTKVTVAVDGSTTYSTTRSSDASALAVGKCLTATGQADSTGAVAATRIAISNPDSSGSCSTGFGRFGGGQGGGQGGARGGTGGAA